MPGRTMTPLQLEDSFFTALETQANPAYQLPAEGGGRMPQPAVEPQIQMVRLKGEQKRYQLTLTVESSPASEGDEPYRIHCQIVGQFVVDDAFENDDLDRLVAINGASILYSALREMVLLVTGRCAWGAVQLPTVNFKHLDLQNDE